MTRQEHRKNTHSFRSNLAEHNFTLRNVDEVLDDARNIIYGAKGKVQSVKVKCMNSFFTLFKVQLQNVVANCF